MPLYIADLTADAPPFLTIAFLKSSLYHFLTTALLKASLSHFLASGRILALFLCDLAFGPSPAKDIITALFVKANYAADFKVQICGSAFPVVGNWLTFLPSAKACVDIPWFFTVLGVLIWFVGVLSLVWLLVRVVWVVVHFLVGRWVDFAFWVVRVLGRWLGMEEGPREVPVVVVVDTEGRK